MNGHLGELSDEQLARMAREGNRVAFESLFHRYLPVVYSQLRVKLPLGAVEDVTQQVFIGAMQGIERFREDASFRTWLLSIARYKVADYYRKQERRVETVPFEAEMHGHVGDSGSRDEWEEEVLVRICLGHLPGHYQEVLLLRFAEGLKFKTIAQELEISLDAAKSRYRRAVAALAEEMEREK